MPDASVQVEKWPIPGLTISRGSQTEAAVLCRNFRGTWRPLRMRTTALGESLNTGAISSERGAIEAGAVREQLQALFRRVPPERAHCARVSEAKLTGQSAAALAGLVHFRVPHRYTLARTPCDGAGRETKSLPY